MSSRTNRTQDSSNPRHLGTILALRQFGPIAHTVQTTSIIRPRLVGIHAACTSNLSETLRTVRWVHIAGQFGPWSRTSSVLRYEVSEVSFRHLSTCAKISGHFGPI